MKGKPALDERLTEILGPHYDTEHILLLYKLPPSSDKGRLEEKLIRHVVTAIRDHIAIYTHKHEVYFDEDRLVPGYQYNEALAKAICRSACMFVIYWPSYLESDYCRKEINTILGDRGYAP